MLFNHSFANYMSFYINITAYIIVHFLLNIITNTKYLLMKAICGTLGWVIKKIFTKMHNNALHGEVCQCPHTNLFESMIELINFNDYNLICKTEAPG